MHTTSPIARLPEVPEFARTHCMRCAAGWTRSLANGSKTVVCLLDREVVLTNMTDCDRYELREQEQE
jgi:hypothetical protein